MPKSDDFDISLFTSLVTVDNGNGVSVPYMMEILLYPKATVTNIKTGQESMFLNKFFSFRNKARSIEFIERGSLASSQEAPG